MFAGLMVEPVGKPEPSNRIVVKPGSAGLDADESVTCVAAHPGIPARNERPSMAAQLANRRDFTDSPQSLGKKYGSKKT
jgi:hypothetical protein